MHDLVCEQPHTLYTMVCPGRARRRREHDGLLAMVREVHDAALAWGRLLAQFPRLHSQRRLHCHQLRLDISQLAPQGVVMCVFPHWARSAGISTRPTLRYHCVHYSATILLVSSLMPEDLPCTVRTPFVPAAAPPAPCILAGVDNVLGLMGETLCR